MIPNIPYGGSRLPHKAGMLFADKAVKSVSAATQVRAYTGPETHGTLAYVPFAIQITFETVVSIMPQSPLGIGVNLTQEHDENQESRFSPAFCATFFVPDL